MRLATQCLVTTGMFSLLKAWKMFPFHQNVLCYRNVSVYLFLTKLSFVSRRKTGQLHNVFVWCDNIFNGLTWTFLTHILNLCKQRFKFRACTQSMVNIRCSLEKSLNFIFWKKNNFVEMAWMLHFIVWWVLIKEHEVKNFPSQLVIDFKYTL